MAIVGLIEKPLPFILAADIHGLDMSPEVTRRFVRARVLTIQQLFEATYRSKKKFKGVGHGCFTAAATALSKLKLSERIGSRQILECVATEARHERERHFQGREDLARTRIKDRLTKSLTFRTQHVTLAWLKEHALDVLGDEEQRTCTFNASVFDSEFGFAMGTTVQIEISNSALGEGIRKWRQKDIMINKMVEVIAPFLQCGIFRSDRSRVWLCVDERKPLWGTIFFDPYQKSIDTIFEPDPVEGER